MVKKKKFNVLCNCGSVATSVSYMLYGSGQLAGMCRMLFKQINMAPNKPTYNINSFRNNSLKLRPINMTPFICCHLKVDIWSLFSYPMQESPENRKGVFAVILLYNVSEAH